jgi:hypothetical protein
MVKRQRPPSQGWRTFLCNHAPDIAAMDPFVVPTHGFDLLYAFVVIRLDRKAFPWDGAPRYMIRDRERIYGSVVTRRLRGLARRLVTSRCNRRGDIDRIDVLCLRNARPLVQHECP